MSRSREGSGTLANFTWADYQARVRDFALGLAGLGVGRGDVVALIGDNRPDWVAGEIAAHAARRHEPRHLPRRARRGAYLLGFGEAKVVLAEDEEQVDKLLGLGDRIPSVRHIVYSDPRGMRKYRDGRLMSAAAVPRGGGSGLPASPTCTTVWWM